MEKKRDSFFLPNKKKDIKPAQEKKKEFNQKRQEQFNKNRGVNNEEKEKNGDKKPFDKKAYRLKKYSKKYKLEQWEEQRKKKLLREYNKEVKDNAVAGSYKPKNFDEDTTDGNEVGRFVRHPDFIAKVNEEVEKPKFIKKDKFQKAKEQFDKIKEAKLAKKEQFEKAKEEKRQKIQEYHKKKQERFKKLSKKTKKGQPVMTGRLELLLEKIQKG